MKEFNPLLTRKQQKLAPIPDWLYSLSKQKALLAKKGLREIVVSNERGSWTTTEAIKSTGPLISDEPTLIQGIDVHGDRRSFEDGVNYVRSLDPTPDTDEVSIREKRAYDIFIQVSMKKFAELDR